jgi:hypothetical protein
MSRHEQFNFEPMDASRQSLLKVRVRLSVIQPWWRKAFFSREKFFFDLKLASRELPYSKKE